MPASNDASPQIISQSKLYISESKRAPLALRTVSYLLLLVALFILPYSEGYTRPPWSLRINETVFICLLAIVCHSILSRFNKVGLRLSMMLDLCVAALLIAISGGADSVFILLPFIIPVFAALTIQSKHVLIWSVGALMAYAGGVVISHWKTIHSIQVNNYLLRSWASASIGIIVVGILSAYLSRWMNSAKAAVELEKQRRNELQDIYQNVLESMNSGLITAGTSGEILTINKTAMTILGIAPPPPTDKQTGLSNDGLSNQQEKAWIGQNLISIDEGFQPFLSSSQDILRKRMIYKRDDTDIVLGLSTSPLVDRDGATSGTVINFQDLTPIESMRKRVEQSERLATLGRVAAGIAHELRNPLVAISGPLQIIRSHSDISEDIRELAELAVTEIDRLDDVVSGLLDYASPTNQEQFASICLNTWLPEACNTISTLISKSESSIIVECDIDRSMQLNVRGNTYRLQGVLWNLVLNAIQADAPSPVQVSLKSTSTHHTNRTRHSAEHPFEGNHQPQVATISVRDKGTGMESHTVKNLFEPFYTTKATGTGLGLAIVHRTIIDHGGRIRVDSTPGKGTTFHLDLPSINLSAKNTSIDSQQGDNQQRG